MDLNAGFHGSPETTKREDTHDSSCSNRDWLFLKHDTKCACSIRPASYCVSRDLENNEALGW